MKVLFVARLVSFKDPLMFVKAAKTLPEHKFIVAGDGTLMQECKRIASGNVVFYGWVLQEKVNELMDEADVFCQLSPFENIWSASLVQALKHGKAVVCTNAGYTASYLKHGVHVLLVPPNDYVALAKTIKKLAVDDALRDFLGRNAGRYVAENLSVPHITLQIHNLLVETVRKWNGNRNRVLSAKFKIKCSMNGCMNSCAACMKQVAERETHACFNVELIELHER